MSGGEVNQDVFVDVHGDQIKAAFDMIDARIKQIQSYVDVITKRSKEAGEAFGGSLQGSLQKFNKISSQLETFQKNLQKNNPDFLKQQEVDKAYAELDRRASASANKRSKEEAALWAKYDQDRITSAQRLEQTKERLATQRWERERAQATTAEKEQARLANQNQYKAGRETTRADVENASTLNELENQRATAIDRITRARGMLGQFGAQEDAQLHVILAQERERLRLAEQRISVEERSVGTDNAPDKALRNLALKEELRAQSDITAVEARRDASSLRLNELLSERVALTGKERVEQNELIREEIERNKLIDARLVALQKEAAAQERANAKPASSSPALFGQTGITGIVARTAAYGLAAQALFGIQSTLMSGAQFLVQWDDGLAKLGAIANATAPEMAELKQTIVDIGKESRFSLIDLTEMATKLAQAGVSVSGMKDALRSVSTLAAASGSTPDEAVDLVTAALGAFQLQGNEAGRVADEMTAALNRTRLTVQQAAQAIQYVGTTAYESNIPLEQLLATAGALSQAGIKSGSTIGTGFRQFLVDLQTPSEKLTEQLKRLGISMGDVDVKTRGLPAVIETLGQKGFGAAQAYGSLETRAAAFYLVAKNNLPLMNELEMSFADQGAAAIAQDRAMNSLSAQWQRFKNIIADSFQSNADSLLTTAKNLVMQIGDLMERMHKDAEKYRDQSNSPNAPFYRKNLEPYLATGLEAILNGPQIGNETGGSIGGLGTWLRNLGRDAGDATGQMQQLEAAINKTSQASSEQRDTVSALDKEILRLTTQKEALRGKTGEVTAETVTLMSRFEGLSRHITGATGDVEGLIGALEHLRTEQARALMDDISAQTGALYSRKLDAAQSRNTAVRQIYSDAGFGQLNQQERNAVSQLGGANGRQAAQVLLDASKRFEQNNIAFAKLLTAAASNQQTIFSSEGQINTLNTEKGLLDAGTTRFGQSLSHNLTEISGALDRLRVATGPDRSKVKSQLTILLKTTEDGVNNMMGRHVRPQDRQLLQQALAELLSDKNQMSDILTPTKAEDTEAAKADRLADKQAQLLSFGSPISGPVRITSGLGHRASPGGIGSTNHQGIDIAAPAGAAVYAAADGVIAFAGARGGYGNLIIIDHGLNTETRYAHLSVIDVSVGQEVSKGQKIGRVGMTGNATGPHLHFERRLNGKIDRNPLSTSAPGSAADISDKAQKLQDDAEKRAERNELATARLKTKNADQDLQDKLKNLKYAYSEPVLDAGIDAVEKSFDEWANDLRAQAKDELDKNGATDGERAERMAEVEQQIKQRRAEMEQSIYDAVIANFERVMKALQESFDRAMKPSQDALATAQARVDGLGRYSLQGKVPDYVQQLAQNKVAAAQEDVGRAQLENLPDYISKASAELDRLQKKLATLPQTDGQWENTNQLVQQQTDKVHDLTTQYASLQQQFAAGNQIPTTFSDGIQKAVQAYRQAHDLTASFTQMLNMNLGDALTILQTTFESLFTDLTSGTMSVKEAFRNMAKNVIKYLQQMLVKMLAVKLMQMALNLFAPSTGAVAPGLGASINPIVNGIDPLAALLHGGQVKAYHGRYIGEGVPNRDSVNARIARGEYVVRKTAVDSVGLDFMHSLNERGSMALKGLSPKIVLPPPAQQLMNVYVVAPEEKPTLGPNDILVTIANDIYRGGQTKQLIKQVAQGG